MSAAPRARPGAMVAAGAGCDGAGRRLSGARRRSRRRAGHAAAADPQAADAQFSAGPGRRPGRRSTTPGRRGPARPAGRVRPLRPDAVMIETVSVRPAPASGSSWNRCWTRRARAPGPPSWPVRSGTSWSKNKPAKQSPRWPTIARGLVRPGAGPWRSGADRLRGGPSAADRIAGLIGLHRLCGRRRRRRSWRRTPGRGRGGGIRWRRRGRRRRCTHAGGRARATPPGRATGRWRFPGPAPAAADREALLRGAARRVVVEPAREDFAQLLRAPPVDQPGRLQHGARRAGDRNCRASLVPYAGRVEQTVQAACAPTRAEAFACGAGAPARIACAGGPRWPRRAMPRAVDHRERAVELVSEGLSGGRSDDAH